MSEVAELAEKAVQTAKEWNMSFDYSAESIASLEELAQMIYKTNKSQHLPDDVIWNASAVYGAYLGETLLRNGLRELGFEWAESDEGKIVIRRDDNWMSPISKVHKRLINGPEDSLTSFYSFSLALAQGEIDL